MYDSDERSDGTQAVIEVVERLAKPVEIQISAISPERGSVIAVPKGFELKNATEFLTPPLERPVRRSGTSTVTTVASFIEHVNRFKDAHSVIFADDTRTAPSLTAVLDYHEKTSVGAPRFGTHRTFYKFPLSDEWVFWTQKLEGLSQSSFAEIIEKRIRNILPVSLLSDTTKDNLTEMAIVPAGRDKLREVAKGLSVHVESKVSQQRNGNTGETSLLFQESHTDENGESIRIPEGFVVAIPVFRGGPAYQIAIRLRYRVKAQAITWTLEPDGVDEVFRHAFDEACERARSETELPLLFGKPEA